MATLNRDQIRAKADDIPIESVEVPEWGGDVKVRMLGSGSRLRWMIAREKRLEDDTAADPTALLVTEAAVDDEGKQLFTVQDTDWLSTSNGDVVERIANKIAVMNGLIDGADSDAEGNSDATPSGDSPTDSPLPSDVPSQS